MAKRMGFTDQPAAPEPEDPSKKLVPRDINELDTANAPKAIESAKNAAVLPLFAVMSEEIIRRFETGELTAETKGMKLSTLINNLTKILAAVNKSAVIIVNPPASEKKDPVHLRKNSAMHLSDAERKARREAVDAEIVDPKDPS